MSQISFHDKTLNWYNTSIWNFVYLSTMSSMSGRQCKYIFDIVVFYNYVIMILHPFL